MSTLDARQLNRMWVEETPSGTINGSNTAFTLSQTPIENDAVDLYLDGLELTRTVHYTISGTSITMTTAPALAQTLRASYIQKIGGT